MLTSREFQNSRCRYRESRKYATNEMRASFDEKTTSGILCFVLVREG